MLRYSPMKALVASALALALLVPQVSRAAGKSGFVTVQCPVEGAAVSVDGKSVGVVPLAAIALAPGKHTVRVKKLGYLEYSETLQIASGKTSQIIADLLPFAGILKLRCNIAGAQVTVDGKPVGKSPLEQEIKIGKRVVGVAASGYAAYSETLRVNAGGEYALDVKLEKPGRPSAAPSASAGGDEMELEALAPPAASAAASADRARAVAASGKARSVAKGSDEMELEGISSPAARTSDAPDMGDMALVAPTLARPGAKGRPPPPAGGDSAMPLEEIQARNVAAVAASKASDGPLGIEVIESTKPWYMEYWAWGAGAAAVVGSGVLVAALVNSGSKQTGPTVNADWTLGGGVH